MCPFRQTAVDTLNRRLESDGIIIVGKPPALPGDSQSLTFPGI
jgi:hypothetical protein